MGSSVSQVDLNIQLLNSEFFATVMLEQRQVTRNERFERFKEQTNSGSSKSSIKLESFNAGILDAELFYFIPYRE